MALNIAHWAIGLPTPRLFWDLSRYAFRDVTLSDARDAHRTSHFDDCSENEEAYEDRETRPSYLRTLWFTIRKTKDAAWVQRRGSVPMTEAWSQWCGEAEREAQLGNRRWAAMTRKSELLSNSTGT